jgi:hypothetical protein
VKNDGGYLRKAVNFSILGGKQAGANVRRAARGRRPKLFTPVDLGWVIPLHRIGVGRVFGKIPVKGKLALRLHYLMTAYRNYNARNFFGYLRIAFNLIT